ncbi:MAG: SRPBCC family protein [Pseudomonadota bacterium]
MSMPAYADVRDRLETVSYDLIINVPAADAWAKLRDLTQAHNYVPDVTRTEITTDLREGVGAARKVYLSDNPDGLDETVVEWRDGEGFTIRVHKGEERAIPIFDHFFFQYAIEEAGTQTVFKPAIKFLPRFGPIGKVLSALVLKRAFGTTLSVIAQSLKEYYETGEPTPQERRKAIRKEITGK